MKTRQPLVSIMIPNYNHSRYLDECISSALAQTYPNIEIIVLDNASEDASMEVAAKYRSSRVRVCRNTYNILNATYRALDELSTGKYKMLLCADDYMEPAFVEKAVAIMEKYPNIGYVHGERDFITEDGSVIELEPFYNCSFVAPGHDVMPLYMVTTVAHPSQGIFRTSAFLEIGGYDMEIDHMNADRMLWFYLSYVSDYAYIQEKMSNIRVGNQTETFITQSNFQHPILCHLTILDMVRFAKRNGLEAVYAREKEALTRLARDFLNYAAGMLAVNDRVCASRYLDYIKVLSDEVSQEETWRKMADMCQESAETDLQYLARITGNALQKPRNYEPPANYEKIDLEEL